MLFLDSAPDITPITNLISTWIHIGQALVGSIGALAAKQWIQRIVVGTIGVEVAGSLVDILTKSVPPSH